jgi:hypothetical protein
VPPWKMVKKSKTLGFSAAEYIMCTWGDQIKNENNRICCSAAA